MAEFSNMAAVNLELDSDDDMDLGREIDVMFKEQLLESQITVKLGLEEKVAQNEYKDQYGRKYPIP